MVIQIFPWVFLVFLFVQCKNLCSSPKYLKKHNVTVDTSNCIHRTSFTTREHCLSHCFEEVCSATFFADHGQTTVCCTYFGSSDLYYLDGEFTLYYKSGINICEANQNRVNCRSCVNGYDIKTGCMTCMKNYDPDSDCTTCIGNYDLDSNCTTCLKNYNLSTGCGGCLGNFALASQCTNCTWNWAGVGCDFCDFGLKGPNCDECAMNVQWDGEYTREYSYNLRIYKQFFGNQKQIEFIFSFSGPHCQHFTGFNILPFIKCYLIPQSGGQVVILWATFFHDLP